MVSVLTRQAYPQFITRSTDVKVRIHVADYNPVHACLYRSGMLNEINPQLSRVELIDLSNSLLLIRCNRGEKRTPYGICPIGFVFHKAVKNRRDLRTSVQRSLW